MNAPGPEFDWFGFLRDYGNFQGVVEEALRNITKRQDTIEGRFVNLCEEVTKLRIFQGRTTLFVGLGISMVTAIITVIVAKALGWIFGG
jgi:hypothetical protein